MAFFAGKSGRKQWTVHNRPGGSLRRLRSQLAEDGCPESQVVLAKQLLEDRSEVDSDKEENAKLGVYWLTKASEQGNLEATDILRQCLNTGRGITEHNYYDVKNCLDMSQDEKLARRAAREMFLSLSNGEDFITTEQLQRRMRELTFSSGKPSGSKQSDKNRLQKSLQDNCNDTLPEDGLPESSKSDGDDKFEDIQQDWSERQGEKLTESVLVSAASNYANGMLPIVSQALCLVDPVQLELDSVPLFERPFVHPMASLRRLYAWLVEIIGRRGIPLRKFFFTSHIHTVVLVILYTLFGTESLVLFIPLAIYYLSFVVMVIASFQMLQKKRELIDFRAWSGLFLSYSGENLNAEEAEYQFCRNNMKPYGHFFLALLLNLIIYPLIAHLWTPQSEFTIISITLTLLTLINFTWRDSSRIPDLLALFSFGVHVLAKYPYETDIVVAQTWRFLDMKVPTFASYVVGNGIEFCLNFRVVFYLLIPAVFAKMAARDGWRGTYKTLIPHCVTLSWWQIAILSSQGATWYGLIRGALALVGLVLFLPIAGLASFILPMVATAKYLSMESDMAMRIFGTACLAGSPFLVSWYLGRLSLPSFILPVIATANYFSMEVHMALRIFIIVLIGGLPFLISWILKKIGHTKYNWIITTVQLAFGIAAGIFLCWPTLMEIKRDFTSYELAPTLSWEQYQNYCHQPAWEESSSKVQVQARCAQLEGISVTWEGYVTNVRLKSLKNNLAYALDKLPEPLKSPLTCWLGEPYKDTCNATNKISRNKCKTIMEVQRKKQKCDLSAWNWYEFEISVKMKNGMWGSNAEVVLIGDRSFANFSLNIYPGDKIWFSGTLMNTGLEGESMLGGADPHIDLEETGCLACHAIDLKSAKRYQYQLNLNSMLKYAYLGMKTILNFLLNPIVIFK